MKKYEEWKLLNEIGESKEDLEMMDIINKNHNRVTKANIAKAKKAKRETVIDYISLAISSAIFVGGLVYLLSVLGCLRF